MLRFCDNPEIVCPRTDDLATISGRWWIGHTKARCEKAFAVDMTALGISYFLPMIERVTFSGGRKRRGMLPLFSSYVFFAGDEQVRYQALLTDRLCRVIEVHDQPRLLSELTATHRALAGKIPLDPYPFAAVGRRVRVMHGPLEGIEGVVVRRDGGEKLVLEVSLLGQGAAMEIAPELLESIESLEPAQRRAS